VNSVMSLCLACTHVSLGSLGGVILEVGFASLPCDIGSVSDSQSNPTTTCSKGFLPRQLF
jgi:hypothetical protein